jgi:ubiquinone/menaquinone biosynthesis C-methylase UbiE
LITKKACIQTPQTGERTRRFLNSMETLRLLDYIVYSTSIRRINKVRTFFAHKYISGKGIEIGAQGNPLQVDIGTAVVTYIDRLSPEQNKNLHNLKAQELIPVDVFTEADDLRMFSNESVDFVIANHLLEHIPDPISAIKEWLRIIKDKGTLFLSVPNYCCNEYDFQRRPEKLSHIIDDFENKTKDKKEEHWKDFVEIVDGIMPNSPEFKDVLHKQYRAIDNRSHMHVYNKELINEIIDYVRTNLSSKLQVIDSLSFSYSFEIILIIKKQQLGVAPSRFSNMLRYCRNVRLLLLGK